MFNINDYKYDEENCYIEVGGESMMYHCHHYLTNLQKTIYDAEYIDGFMLMASCAADAAYYQLSNLCEGLSIEESKQVAQNSYKVFGNGLVDLSAMNEDGIELTTTKSILSKTWQMQFGESKKPVDPYTTGFLAAVYGVIYKKNLKDLHIVQTTEMASGDAFNTHSIRVGEPNITLYPKKSKVAFKPTPKPKSSWEHADLITKTFSNANQNFVGNEEGYIPGFGVYVVCNQSDYVNRVQFEFMKAVEEVAGEYGTTLAGELLMQSGLSCGFFTLGGIMSSPEWEGAVKPYLKSTEDWAHAAIALTNNMGWGYQIITEISKEKMVFRNYTSFEDYSYLKMYGESDHIVHTANSGGWSSLQVLLYVSDLVETGKIDTIAMFEEVRKSKFGYKTIRTKGIANGDDYLEAEVVF